MHALKYVLAAARPFRINELALSIAVSKGLSQHEEYDIRGDADVEGRTIVLECSPLLILMPDGTVQPIHSSLQDYLLEGNAPIALSDFQFEEHDVHTQLASTLITYLSLRCFDTDLISKINPNHYLLEYPSKWVVYHSTKTGASKQTAEKLANFFQTTQGWRWLELLTETDIMSFGHLQLLVAETRERVQLLQLQMSL